MSVTAIVVVILVALGGVTGSVTAAAGAKARAQLRCLHNAVDAGLEVPLAERVCARHRIPSKRKLARIARRAARRQM